MFLSAQKTTDSPQFEAATSALHGVIAGLVLAMLLAWLLGRRNLGASFAFWPCMVGGWLCLRWLAEPYLGGMLVTAGLLGWAVRRWRITGALKAGGEIAQHARRARTIREVGRNWWDRRRLARYGPMDWPGTYAIGEDESRAVVHIPVGHQEGRHMLLIGATGAGKTTTLSWALWRHLEAGCVAILIDPKGDPQLVEPPARRPWPTAGRSTASHSTRRGIGGTRWRSAPRRRRRTS